MRVSLLQVALVAMSLATALCANLTAALRPHDGTYTMGKAHQNIARQVRTTIIRNLRLMNAWAPDVRLSQGEYGTEVDDITGVVTKVMTKFKMLNLAANAGTAVNLVGCRGAAGRDLDFWTLGQMKVAGVNALRIEFNHNEDNVWLSKDHFKTRGGKSMHPYDYTLAVHANDLMDEYAEEYEGITDRPHTFPAQDTEVDVWTDGYHADKPLLKLIRKKFHSNKGLLINLKQRTDRTHKYVKIVDFPDLIVQKADLVITWKRQIKNDGVGWPHTSHADGKRKLTNDALDLYCLCHHYRFAKPYVQNHYGTFGHIKKICDIAFNLVAQAVQQMSAAAYNTLAHAAASASVGVHECTGPDGPCLGGAAAPAAVQTLGLIQPALDEYLAAER